MCVSPCLASTLQIPHPETSKQPRDLTKVSVVRGLQLSNVDGRRSKLMKDNNVSTKFAVS